MGMITITLNGSFGQETKTFKAIDHGHADAVAQAIEYLAADLLPWSNSADHRLHTEGCTPDKGFER